MNDPLKRPDVQRKLLEVLLSLLDVPFKLPDVPPGVPYKLTDVRPGALRDGFPARGMMLANALPDTRMDGLAG